MDAQVGRVELILGPMFSGKTTELIRRLRRYKHGRKRCVLIKWKHDTRYSKEKAATHDKLEEDAVGLTSLAPDTPISAGTRLCDLSEETDVFGVDEGQFFPDIVEFCERMANCGKIVVVASLNSTFQRKPFNSTGELVAIADGIVKFSAVCMNCARDAAFSKRISDELDLNVIGGSDKYVASCRSCFHETWKSPNVS